MKIPLFGAIGGSMLLVAALLLLAAIAMPHWLWLQTEDGTYYAGLFQFCGHRVNLGEMGEEYFCFPADTLPHGTPFKAMVMNELKNEWRSATLGLCFGGAVFNVIGALSGFVAACLTTKRGCGVIIAPCWIINAALALTLTTAMIIFFVVSLFTDRVKMLFVPVNSPMTYERKIDFSVYLAVGAILCELLGMALACIGGVTLFAGTRERAARRTFPKEPSIAGK